MIFLCVVKQLNCAEYDILGFHKLLPKIEIAKFAFIAKPQESRVGHFNVFGCGNEFAKFAFIVKPQKHLNVLMWGMLLPRNIDYADPVMGERDNLCNNINDRAISKGIYTVNYCECGNNTY